MSHAINLHDGTGIAITDPGLGILLAYGSTVPAAASAGYAPAARFIKTNGTGLSTTSYINIGTRASANFVTEGLSGAIVATCLYGELLATDMGFFVANRAYQVQSIIARPLVAGTDASAVTGEIRKAPSGTASASGTVLHTGTIDLKGAANTNQTLTLSTTAATILLANGDALSLDVTGVLTAARGIVSVLLLPV